MEPMYPEGTLLWCNRIAYLLKTPARGDIVIVHTLNPRDRVGVKRVVGLPGEHVAWDASSIWIHGVSLDEPYARKGRAVPGDDQRNQVRLGSDEYFVVGDNRLYSRDSRVYGPVRRRQILGRVYAGA